MIVRTLALAAALLLAAADPVEAKNDKAKGKGKPAHAGKTVSSPQPGSDGVAAAAAAGATLAGILLSDQDKETIAKYFDANPAPSAKPLPPGIAKNLERGKPMPPGIAKRGVPDDLARQVSIPEGFDLETVGTDVVLIEKGSRIIAEVLKDVLAR